MDSIQVRTRDLTASEVQEFFAFIDKLVPAYRTGDCDRELQIKNGGSMGIGFYPQHVREAVYAKVKWG